MEKSKMEIQGTLSTFVHVATYVRSCVHAIHTEDLPVETEDD